MVQRVEEFRRKADKTMKEELEKIKDKLKEAEEKLSETKSTDWKIDEIYRIILKHDKDIYDKDGVLSRLVKTEQEMLNISKEMDNIKKNSSQEFRDHKKNVLLWATFIVTASGIFFNFIKN